MPSSTSFCCLSLTVSAFFADLLVSSPLPLPVQDMFGRKSASNTRTAPTPSLPSTPDTVPSTKALLVSDRLLPSTYAGELEYLKHGYPLYDPSCEPDTSSGWGRVGIVIGDIGFVSLGKFTRMHNAIRSQDLLDRASSPSQSWHISEQDGLEHVITDDYLPAQSFCSEGITVSEQSEEIRANKGH